MTAAQNNHQNQKAVSPLQCLTEKIVLRPASQKMCSEHMIKICTAIIPGHMLLVNIFTAIISLVLVLTVSQYLSKPQLEGQGITSLTLVNREIIYSALQKKILICISNNLSHDTTNPTVKHDSKNCLKRYQKVKRLPQMRSHMTLELLHYFSHWPSQQKTCKQQNQGHCQRFHRMISTKHLRFHHIRCRQPLYVLMRTWFPHQYLSYHEAECPVPIIENTRNR